MADKTSERAKPANTFDTDDGGQILIRDDPGDTESDGGTLTVQPLSRRIHVRTRDDTPVALDPDGARRLAAILMRWAASPTRLSASLLRATESAPPAADVAGLVKERDEATAKELRETLLAWGKDDAEWDARLIDALAAARAEGATGRDALAAELAKVRAERDALVAACVAKNMTTGFWYWCHANDSSRDYDTRREAVASLMRDARRAAGLAPPEGESKAKPAPPKAHPPREYADPEDCETYLGPLRRHPADGAKEASDG